MVTTDSMIEENCALVQGTTREVRLCRMRYGLKAETRKNRSQGEKDLK